MRFIFFNFALVKSQGNIQGIREQPLQQIEVSAGETARVEKDGKKNRFWQKEANWRELEFTKRDEKERVRRERERWWKADQS